MIRKEVYTNNTLIPSRSERRSDSVKWSVAWGDYAFLRGVNAEVKAFCWKLQQDLLPLGARLHRRNADKRCMLEVTPSIICEEIETREHAFIKCEAVSETINLVKTVIMTYLERNVTVEECLFLAFNHRDFKKRQVASWFAVNSLYAVYLNRSINGNQLLLKSIKELDWNLELNRKIGSRFEMINLKRILDSKLRT